MCLAIPGEVLSIETDAGGFSQAEVGFGGIRKKVCLAYTPDAVVGDMDSLPEEARAAIPPERIFEVAEQDSTDFEKALSRIEAPFVLALGMTGARIDHELAAYHVLVSRPEVCVILGAEDVVFHLPTDIALDLPLGTRFSLFPMQSVTGVSDGLRWPIKGLAFHPARKIGTSNEVTASPVRLGFEGAGMLAVLPRAHLSAVIGALVLSDER